MTRALFLFLLAGCVPPHVIERAEDRDADGYVASELGGPDCDDRNQSIHPGVDEICGDGVDNDCDGNVDDDGVGSLTWYLDADGDDYGIPSQTTTACTRPQGYADNDTDCADDDRNSHPGADEVCDDISNDCDAFVDEDAVDAPTWYLDVDGDGYGVDDTALQQCDQPNGYAPLSGDCDDFVISVNPGAQEVCSGRDDDCDGLTDQDDPSMSGLATWYYDGDDDGWGIDSDTIEACDEPDGYAANPGDCEDGLPAINPGATEVCNDDDDDCDGLTDDADSSLDPLTRTAWYFDSDDDGYGVDSSQVVQCSAPGLDWSVDGGDCDDTRGSVYPGAPELCDGIVNTCGGNLPAVESDDDGDGYVECDVAAGPGWEGAGSPGGDDCVDIGDGAVDIYPSAPELCDGLINDCFNLTIAGIEVDDDGDGFVECTIIGVGSWLGDPDVVGGDDCDDTSAWSASVYPGAVELCDGVLNDCLDAGVPPEEGDDDSDQYVECAVDPGGWHGALTPIAGEDCVDDPAGLNGVPGSDINPGASEVCDDGVDNDCTGHARECRFAGEYIVDDDADVVITADYQTLGWDHRAGRSLATGNMDGNGYDDLLIGAGFVESSGSPPAVNPGSAYRVIGRETFPATTSLPNGLSVDGSGSDFPYDVVGEWVASCDVDDDGLDDLVLRDRTYGVVATGPSGPIYGTLSHRVRVFLSPSASVPYDPDDADYTFEALGSAAIDGFICGRFTAGLVPDVVMPGGGNVRVYHAPHGAIDSLVSPEAWITHGAISSVALGDLDDDGFDEVALGVMTDDYAGSLTGAVHVVEGPNSGTLDLTSATPTIVGVAAGDELGGVVAVGDFDGDGAADLFVANHTEVLVFRGPLTGLVAYSAVGADVTIAVDDASTLVIRDLDNDGMDDAVVVAGSAAQPVAYLFYGDTLVGDVGIQDADAVCRTPAVANFGVQQVAAGDVNGDGVLDLAVSTPLYGGPDQGRAYLLFGSGF